MKGDKKVLSYLNQALKQELTAINQYFLHAKMYQHMGLKRLHEHEHHESIDEMKHADKLIERILLLEGLPNLQSLNKLLIGESLPEGLKCDLEAERAARVTLVETIGICEQANDYVSRAMVNTILDETEQHIDFLETQVELINKVGVENYLQSQM